MLISRTESSRGFELPVTSSSYLLPIAVTSFLFTCYQSWLFRSHTPPRLTMPHPAQAPPELESSAAHRRSGPSPQTPRETGHAADVEESSAQCLPPGTRRPPRAR